MFNEATLPVAPQLKGIEEHKTHNEGKQLKVKMNDGNEVFLLSWMI